MAGARIGPWRRTFQTGASLLFLLAPFVELGGRGLLRLDLETRTLEAFGGAIHLDDLHLVLLLGLIALFAFLLATVVLGRVWCGWACPQTILSDLVEWTARRLRVSGPRPRRTVAGTVLSVPGFQRA